MKRLLAVLMVLGLAACAFAPPKPTSYADAPRVPINRPVAVETATPPAQP